MTVTTIDCDYTGQAGVAAAYLVQDGDEFAFVETNTSAAVPRLLDALQAAGGRREQVRYVVVTHIHLDHAGGAGVLMDACPQATLLAHPKAAQHAIDPSRIEAGARQVYGDEAFERLYGEVRPVAAARVCALQDAQEVPLGARTWRFLHTRGHANHHFVLVDEAADGVFTGDAFGIHYPRLQERGTFAFPSTTPTDFDPAAAHEAIDRIVDTGVGRAWPTHFGEVNDLSGAAAQMHRSLDEHARVVDQADGAGLEGDELDAYCVSAVGAIFERLLVEHGLAEDAEARRLVGFDAALNAQGLAFAVRKRRYKRSRG